MDSVVLGLGLRNTRVCAGRTRRELLRLGGLGALGLLPGVRPVSASDRAPGFGRARHVALIYLFGGASQFETWDPKPDAPSDTRGEFGAIETNVSGIRISELAPRLARCAHRYSLIRSLAHRDNTHDTAMYTSYTGWPFGRPGTPPPSPDDRPSHGAVLAHFKPSHANVPPVVALGGMVINTPGEVPGQRGGLLGSRYDPFPLPQSPSAPGFHVPELNLSERISALRLDRRRSLLDEVDAARRLADSEPGASGLQGYQHRALDLIGSAQTRRALKMDEESPAVRERYGKSGLGGRLLLARRLFEVGVPCATVHWLDGDNSWDYHSNNFPGHKKSMAVLDQAVSAFIEDLHLRGLLDETLVVVLGEFGRTPKINKDAGRDHWADCYSALLAGGGIQGGRVHGASDKTAAYPAEDLCGPWDIAATLYHLLGVDPRSEYYDRLSRPMVLSQGSPLLTLL